MELSNSVEWSHTKGEYIMKRNTAIRIAMRLAAVVPVAVTLFFVVRAPSAMAQEAPRYEVFAGYGFVRPEGGQASLNGWHGSFAANANNWLGLAMELSGQYGSQSLAVTDASGRVTNVNSTVNFHSLGFGPRFTYRTDRLSPFAHVLVGVSRGNWLRPAIVAGAETSFAAAIGGGFDTKVKEHIGIRIIQAEYVRTHFGSSQQKSVRIATGVIYSF